MKDHSAADEFRQYSKSTVTIFGLRVDCGMVLPAHGLWYAAVIDGIPSIQHERSDLQYENTKIAPNVTANSYPELTLRQQEQRSYASRLNEWRHAITSWVTADRESVSSAICKSNSRWTLRAQKLEMLPVGNWHLAT